MTDGEEAKDGWGFADTRFEVLPNGHVVLTGARYELAGPELPQLLPWFSGKLGEKMSYGDVHAPAYPPPIAASRCDGATLERLRAALGGIECTTEPTERLRRGHGHTAQEIWAIRYSGQVRTPDVVVFPARHEDVVRIVELAQEWKLMLVPYGGGTNVSLALKIPEEEARLVVAVDMRRMNRCLEVNREDRLARFEAGITGTALEEALAQHGMMMGHEPDSLEFSTLGGWIATNASGMKKNRYGNIEQIVVDARAVLPSATLERERRFPRESIGPNPLSYLLGSEGTLGIVTEATVRIRPLPEVRRYGSVLFRSLEAGVGFLRALQASGAAPASVRLMDSTQFQFGLALKPAAQGSLHRLKSRAEKWWVTQALAYDPDQLSVATLVFEGSRAEVSHQQKIIRQLVRAHGGLAAGSENGRRGYQLTFGIAYIRDLAFTQWAIAESFETSAPWSRALDVYRGVERRIKEEHARLGLPGKPFFTGRFTQVYEGGVCIYFYLGFHCKAVADPVAAYSALEHAAREEILIQGGSLSHHHGIGKIRQEFLGSTLGPGAVSAVQRVKAALDPGNLFGLANGAVGLPTLEGRAGLREP